jgi:hypothetical protein
MWVKAFETFLISNGAGDEPETKKLFDRINETLLYPVNPV